MTVPLFATPTYVGDPIDWSISYLGVQGIYDRQVRTALIHAAVDAEKIILRIQNKQNISAKVQRSQINLVRRQLHALITGLFNTQVAPLIAAGKLVAVERAARAGLRASAKFWEGIFPNPVERKAFQSAFVLQACRNIDAMMTRVLGYSYVPLSKRVYKTTALAKGMVDRVINSALARGASAREIATEVKSLIRPNVPGGVSYAAMRLGRTEINNVFHAQSVADAQDSPWVDSMEWHLSAVHKPDPGDACELYAEQVLFAKEAVPKKPHPNCRCYVVPHMISWTEFNMNLVAGVYDFQRKAA